MKKIRITIATVAGNILIGGLCFVPGLSGAHTNGEGMTEQSMMG